MARSIAARFVSMRLNASEDKDADVVRKRIKEFCETAPHRPGVLKYVVLDEADALPAEAQTALLRLMEVYAYNCRFCLICNYISNMSPPIASRCVLLYFRPPSDEQLGALALRLGVPRDAAFAELAALCGRDMRKISNIVRTGLFSTTQSAAARRQLYLHNNRVPPEVGEQVLQTVLEVPLSTGLPALLEQLDNRGFNLQQLYHAALDRLLQTAPPSKHVEIIETLHKNYISGKKSKSIKLFLLSLYLLKF